MELIDCAIHGKQQETFVCGHIVEGLRQLRRVGFFWTTFDPDNPRPDAWCTECEARVRASPGGEWAGEALEKLQPKLLCGACYDRVKQFHMGGEL